jgi:hypothetical protein
MRNAYKIPVGKLLGKRPLGRPRCRWKGNIKMYGSFFVRKQNVKHCLCSVSETV